VFTDMSLSNFKSWREAKSIGLAPITVFFGANSSGKTSLLQAILLLKQTAESADRTRVLHTGDERTLVDLGTMEDLIHNHSNSVGFSFGWTLPDPLEIPKGRPLDRLRFHSIVARKIEDDTEEAPLLYKMGYAFGDASIEMQREEDRSYALTYKGLSLKRRKGRPWPLPAPTRFYGFPDEVMNYYQNADRLADLALAVERQLGRVHYVGPLREYPRRSYLWAGESPANVGVRGELAVPAILAARSVRSHIVRGQTRGQKRIPFEQVIADWLRKMGIIESFKVEPVAKQRKDYEVRVRRTASSTEVLLTDVGFGVSQVLPVLVQSYYAAEHSTIIFEQPEIHLHPRVQADLADVFIDAVHCCKVQFMIESHSEHFLRRLQRRVAEGDISSKDVALYFCYTKGDHSEIEKLHVDEFGNITNWPKDFFGDEVGDLAAMTRAAMQRRKAS